MVLFRSIATVGGFTLLSRITGFIRDILIAAMLGAGTVADSFFVAFRFPNLFRRLFAEGAFASAFVPLFAHTLEAEGMEKARRFAMESFAVLALILALLVALMEIAAPWAVLVLATGFEGQEGKLELATELTRITFPYLFFISLVSLLSGVLNAVGRFAAAAAAPVLLNVVLIVALLGFGEMTKTPAHALAWGVAAAGVIQFLWLMGACWKAGVKIGVVPPRFTENVIVLLKRIIPGAIGAGVYQINLLVDTNFLSRIGDGAVSFLYYADRVNQLPLGVVGVAIGVALLPLLSRQFKAAEKSGDFGPAMHSHNRALEFALLLTVPAAVALISIALPLVTVLFERGAFGERETGATAAALAALATGLPAYVLIKVLTPGFFARGDTATPVRVAGMAMLANIVLNILLMIPFGFVGIALATALSAWMNMMMLGFLLAKNRFLTLDERLKQRFPKILIASLGMGALLYPTMTVMMPLFSGPSVVRIGALTVLICGGLGLYGGLVHLTGAATWGEVKGMLRRRGKGRAAEDLEK